MILALQIFCIVVAVISFFGVVAEKSPVLMAGTIAFTMLAIAIEVWFK